MKLMSLVATAFGVVAFANLPAHAQNAAQAPGKSAQAIPGPAIPPLILLDPTEIRSHPTSARGCWVWMFPQPGLKGEHDVAVAGPIALSSLHTPAGLDWHNKAESLIVGPKATVTVYENQDFRGESKVFAPGAQIGHLRKEGKLIQSIDSLKISCGS